MMEEEAGEAMSSLPVEPIPGGGSSGSGGARLMTEEEEGENTTTATTRREEERKISPRAAAEGGGMRARKAVAADQTRRSARAKGKAKRFEGEEEEEDEADQEDSDEDKDRKKKKSKKGAKKELIVASFGHNTRFWAAFVPCAFVIFALGGKTILGVSVIGLLIGYMFDMMGSELGMLISLWFTLVVLQVALVLSSVFLMQQTIWNIFLLFNIAFFIMSVGIWATVQWTWLQKHPTYSVAVRGMERMLFATFWIPSITITMWGIIAVSGMSNAPFYLLFFLFVSYYLFGMPVHTSFPHLGGCTWTKDGRLNVKREEEKLHSLKSDKQRATESEQLSDPQFYVCNKLDNAVHTMIFLFGPALFHIAIHHRVLFSGWLNMSNFLLVLGLPLLLLRLISSKSRKPLWWTGLPEERMDQLETALSILSTIVIVACFEYRVIFHSYYRSIPLSPPWNYIFVTVALYSFVALIGAHFLGWLGRGDHHRKREDLFVSTGAMKTSLGMFPALVLAVMGSAAAVFAVGLPWYFSPFAFVAAVSLVLFYFLRQLRLYLVFVGSTSVLVAWFVLKSFSFLKYHFEGSVWVFFSGSDVSTFGGSSVATVSTFMILLFVLSALLPGLMLWNQWVVLNSFVFGLHALTMTSLESVLSSNGTGTYPPYLVIGSSLLGIFLTKRLQKEKRINLGACWLVIALHIAKLSLLLHQTGSSILSTFLFVASTSFVFFFYSDTDSTTRDGMSKRTGLINAAVIGIVVAAIHQSFIVRLVTLFSNGREPTSILLFAACMVAWGLGCLPLSFLHFKDVPIVRSLNLFLLSGGLLVTMFQPHVGFSFFVGDTAASTDSQRHTMEWPHWLLLSAFLLTIAAVTKVLPISRSVSARYLYSTALGLCLGLFVSGVYLPYSLQLYIFFVAVFVLTSAFTFGVYYPAAGTGTLLPMVYTCVTALYPILYLLAGQIFGSVPGLVGAEYIKTTRMVVLGICVAFNALIALLIKFQVTKLLASEQRLKNTKLQRTQQTVVMSSLLNKRLLPEWSWMPTCGNVSCLLAFFLSLYLNLHYLHGSEVSVFVLAPILLLLNQDRRLFPMLSSSASSSSRYFPLILFSSLFFFLRSCFYLLSALLLYVSYTFAAFAIDSFTFYASLSLLGVPFIEDLSFFLLLKNTVFLLCAAPIHVIFILWLIHLESASPSSASSSASSAKWIMRRETTRSSLLLLLAPVCLLGMIFANLLSVSILCMVALLMIGVQFYVDKQIRRTGMQSL